MAELTELVKVSNQVKTNLEDRKKTEGHSSLDSVIRSLIADSEAYRLIKAEIEKKDKWIEELKMELKECKNGSLDV